MAKVILRGDVTGVGKRGDIVDVADGYARNYLYPRGMALAASAASAAQATSMRRSRDLRDAKDREGAETIARSLVPAIIKVSAKAHDGKLFGSISIADIVDAVKTQTGIALDRRTVRLDENIKTVGTHEVPVKLHTDVEFRLNIAVAAA